MQNLDKNEINVQADDVLRGTLASCKPSSNELKTLFEQAFLGKKKLRVKLGIDPTNPDLHFGHTVCLHALRKFQQKGHTPVLIIGGYTATVGDPSGRNETRPVLTYAEVEKNAKTYLTQVGKFLDLNKTEVCNNYDWFSKFKLSELLELAHTVTVNQLVAKEAFGSRLEEGNPLYLHEVLYPLLQGYDSVQVKADIEIGGLDQTFNILFGRHVQKHFSQKEQLAIFYPLLVGLEGVRKMSKSFLNYIALNDSPDDIYGKSMSINDDLIIQYFSLITDISMDEIRYFAKELDSYQNSRHSKITAKELKMKLAKNLVSQIYGDEIAVSAEQNFIAQFKENKIPEMVNEFPLPSPVKIVDLLFLSKMVPSKTEAKKLIQNGGVKLSSEKVLDPNLLITEKHKNSIVQIGKRKFVKIV